jgi:hypothetical protein
MKIQAVISIIVVSTLLQVSSGYGGGKKAMVSFSTEVEAAEYRIYELKSPEPKYWAKANQEGRLMIYDHPNMEQPRFEYRDGKICRLGSILCRRIDIIDLVSGYIYRAGGAKPLWRVERVRKN